ncbi:DMT family transporter [Caldanaerobacter sp.]|uniref:DMT family transporter n=1 Tax=Caldanaerobacter sp. TaxID=2930036 RepID=UPI003C786018
MKKGEVLALSAGALWGTTGLFVRMLVKLGLTTTDVAFLRMFFGAFLIFSIIILLRKSLSLPLWSWKYLFGTGILSLTLFNWSYFRAIKLTTLPIAVALLYTAPAFVVVLARIFYGERITPRKSTALLLTIIGVLLVSGALKYLITGEKISVFGVLYGLLSAVGYGLYTIFAKPLSGHIPPEKIAAYTFLVAAIALLPISSVFGDISIFFNTRVIFLGLLFGAFSTAAPYLLYTKALTFMEAGRAAIFTTMEPVVATLIGVFVLQESLSFFEFLGIVSIIFAVILLSLSDKPCTSNIEN